jgi:Flp pilus assembly protein TadB
MGWVWQRKVEQLAVEVVDVAAEVIVRFDAGGVAVVAVAGVGMGVAGVEVGSDEVEIEMKDLEGLGQG